MWPPPLRKLSKAKPTVTNTPGNASSSPSTPASDPTTSQDGQAPKRRRTASSSSRNATTSAATPPVPRPSTPPSVGNPPPSTPPAPRSAQGLGGQRRSRSPSSTPTPRRTRDEVRSLRNRGPAPDVEARHKVPIPCPWDECAALCDHQHPNDPQFYSPQNSSPTVGTGAADDKKGWDRDPIPCTLSSCLIGRNHFHGGQQRYRSPRVGVPWEAAPAPGLSQGNNNDNDAKLDDNAGETKAETEEQPPSSQSKGKGKEPATGSEDVEQRTLNAVTPPHPTLSEAANTLTRASDSIRQAAGSLQSVRPRRRRETIGSHQSPCKARNDPHGGSPTPKSVAAKVAAKEQEKLAKRVRRTETQRKRRAKVKQDREAAAQQQRQEQRQQHPDIPARPGQSAFPAQAPQASQAEEDYVPGWDTLPTANFEAGRPNTHRRTLIDLEPTAEEWRKFMANEDIGAFSYPVGAEQAALAASYGDFLGGGSSCIGGGSSSIGGGAGSAQGQSGSAFRLRALGNGNYGAEPEMDALLSGGESYYEGLLPVPSAHRNLPPAPQSFPSAVLNPQNAA